MSYPLFHPKNRDPRPQTLTTEDFVEKFPAESGCLEFKRSVSDKRIPDTVVAFSNTQGGVILIGVEDTGQVKGAPWSGKSEKKLHELLGSINDPGRYEIHRLTVEDRTVIAVAVASRTEGFAQTSNGRLLVRRGASNRAMVGVELSRFIADRALRHFETTATEVDLAEADPDLLAEMADVWSWSPGGIPDRLEEHGFLERTGGASKLTVAGVLYLVPEPHRILGKTFVEVFRYRGEGNIDDRREEVVGPLPAQVKRATALVLDEIGYELVVIGVTRYELPRLPEVVLREAIANAVAHRSYEASGAAIRVEIRPDRVTVISPGGLPEPVTINNIREQSSARNLVVINALRRYRLAEDAGRGVDIMQDEMASNLLAPPEFDEDGSYVRVTLPFTGVVTPEERVWVNELERRGSIGSMDRLLLVFAARGEVLTNRRARDILGVDNHQARRALQRLRDQGLLVQRGERGGVEYLIEAGLKPPAGLSKQSILDVQLLGEINRLPGVAGGVRLSDEQIDDMVLGMAREGPVTNTMVRERTGLDRIQALAVLAHLVDAGRLERRGERRGTHYVLSRSR